ncbi:MAG TPA: hypothetical protein DEF18_13855 [Muricauda sp.]|nr:hypothetical protein [uncultured Allomuricauda sp.]MBC72380.1 hypothetical protein [Allomuricauda sp.]HBU79179.1 hypothetical protein [Allomuricauda sp.]|tara:strand:+ start:253 stop:846 length:594 start_codon:yes stop_codon:yes gene_type:complete
MKFKYLLLFLFLCFACKEKKTEKNSSISITGQNFENPNAGELNSKAIREVNSGNHDSAKDLFYEALDLEPNNPTILSNIGLYYQNLGLDQKAIEFHNKSLKVSDSTYFISGVNLGNAYYQIGEYSKGIRILDFVIENTSEDGLLQAAYVNRGFNHLGKGECKEAKSDLMTAKSMSSHQKEMDFQIDRLEKKLKDCLQ